MYDCKWLLDLEEHDEPPIFYPGDDLNFLKSIDTVDFGPLVVRWAVEILDAHAKFLTKMANGDDVWLSLTIPDWSLWNNGETLCPDFCILVVPYSSEQLAPNVRFHVPTSADCLALRNWVKQLEREDLVVAETHFLENSDYYRSYIGYRGFRGFEFV